MDETSVSLPFADGEYTFFLPLVRVAAFKREAGCSVYEMFFWLGEHLAQIDDQPVLAGPSPADPEQSVHLIRNALIGSGLEPTAAKKLVEQYCFPARASIHDMKLAWDILSAAVYGVQTPPGKKPKAPAKRTTRSKRAE